MTRANYPLAVVMLAVLLTACITTALTGCGKERIDSGPVINPSGPTDGDWLAIEVTAGEKGGIGIHLVAVNAQGKTAEVSQRDVSTKWPYLALVRVWCRDTNASGVLVGGPVNPIDLTLAAPNGSFTGISIGTVCHLTATVYADTAASVDVSTGTDTVVASDPPASAMITLPPSLPTFGTASPSGTVSSVTNFTIPVRDPAGGVPDPVTLVINGSTIPGGGTSDVGDVDARTFSWNISSLTADGDYNWTVTATTTSGGTDSATGTFTIDSGGGSDTTPPETTITSGPSGTVTSCDATFIWTGTDDVTPVGSLEYSYQVDSGGWSSYDSATQIDYYGLSDGSHTFEVRARDSAMNVDPAPASRTFTVDTSGGAILPEWQDAPGHVITWYGTRAAGNFTGFSTPHTFDAVVLTLATPEGETIGSPNLFLFNVSNQSLEALGADLFDLTTGLMTGNWKAVRLDGTTLTTPGGTTSAWSRDGSGAITISSVTITADGVSSTGTLNLPQTGYQVY